MSELPKIVYDRLRARPEHDRVAQQHPDADLLAAFSEQVLSASEREGVLDHLALCENCRDAIALTLPPGEAAAVSVPVETERDGAISISTAKKEKEKEKKNWAPRFAWPNLHWVALAAGVAVLASFLVLHPRKLNQPALTSTSRQPIASATPSSNSRIAAAPASQSVPLDRSDKGLDRSDKDEVRSKAVSPGLGNRSERSESPTLLANNLAKNENKPSSENALMARNDAPAYGAPAIEKAKPARQEDESEITKTTKKEEQSASAASMEKVRWGIEAGVLQRSLDGGQTWQILLRSDHPLLSYASRDTDVWAGGKAGALFHSSDAGLTWTQVQPSIHDEALRADITQIDLPKDVMPDNEPLNGLRRSKQIAVSTSAGEIWSSADAGETWNKQ
jgi:hypothetical protein